MKIDFLCHDGSPLRCSLADVYGEGQRGIGLGGSEIAMMTLCEYWHKAGHEVVLYNDPLVHDESPFEQRYIHQFDPQADRDILIVFRSPHEAALDAKGLRVWLSCDQYSVGDYAAFAPYAHKIVCISDFHARYFANTYGIRNVTVIDLPIRVEDYTVSVEKVPGRCLFSSVPDRGLMILHAAWPLIKRDFPQATLTITSDYRLWGVGEPRNENFRRFFMRFDGVRFKGAMKRREFVLEQLQSQVHSYPCTYDELMCLSVAESQVAGVVPVTSASGALPTTNMAHVLPGNVQDPTWVSDFVNKVVGLLSDPNLPKIQEDLKKKAIGRFRPERILEEWERKVFK